MAKLEIEVSHRLSTEEVMRRFNLRDEFETEFPGQITDFQEERVGNSIKFSGKAQDNDISGRLVVDSESVRLEINLPWGAGFFLDLDEIKDQIQERMTKFLSNEVETASEA